MRASARGNGVETVDCVVVGSGFGGSVAAYRLAEAGRSVVLLERGRVYPPGSFPRTPSEMSRAFWDPSEGLHGMFDIWSFKGFASVVSSGLGGGSLIYANVLLRKDEKWFVKEDPLPGGGYERWPISYDDLEPHYRAAEEMLGATPFPFGQPAYSGLPKTVAMRESAKRLDLDWQLPPLGVTFAATEGAEPAIGVPIVTPEYGNLHGAPRRTCRLCAECDIGCNDGSKNTLDHNYLSAAKHHGADIRPRHEVRSFRPLESGGYGVDFVRHSFDNEGERFDTSSLPIRTIRCNSLVLAAGAYGTTFLLLKNRDSLPGLSPTVGTRFSGNGDVLGFMMPKRSHNYREFAPSRGPVITSAIRFPDHYDDPDSGVRRRGYYLEDGGYPGFTDWIVERTDLPGLLMRSGRFAVRWIIARLLNSPESGLSAEISRLIGQGQLSGGSLPMLGMGRDVPDGVMRLSKGKLQVDWNTRTSRAYFNDVRSTARAIARDLGVGYVDNPMWLLKRVVSVHPLGGAPIGHTEKEGTCDSFGEVFGHRGLFVADGAAMPGPVGANPSLTIAAMADRLSTRLLETR